MNDRALTCCFHCGLPASNASAWRIAVDGVDHPLCCPGCEAVAHAIVEHGMGDFYRQRSGYAAPAPALPTAAVGAGAAAVEAGADLLLSVDSIRCAACGWLIERRLAGVPGVAAAELNLASGLLRVRLNAGAGTLDTVIAALAAIGYPSHPYDSSRHGASLERERKIMFKRLFVAGLSMMQVMMYVFPQYLAGADGIDAALAALLRWAAAILTVPAVVYAAAPFWRGAWRSLRARSPGMDLPVALGVGAAFGASVVSLLRGQGEVYFDAVTMFIFLLLASQYLELRARCAAAAQLQRLRHGAPARALRLNGYPARRDPEAVDAGWLRTGDFFLVAPGEAVAADGVVAEGKGDIVLALLTGEARPRPCAPGDEVPSGAVNGGQPLVLQVRRAAGESTLARLTALVERAGHGKPAIALWADRVGAGFTAALLVLAVLAFVLWYPSGAAHAWQVAVAVLVVSCPCALSLATPAALAAANGALLRRGVLVVRPHVLETLRRATHVVFDKTGTLTFGAPRLAEVTTFGGPDAAACLAIAAALEHASGHPLAAAFKDAAGARQAVASALSQHAGEGVAGIVDGVAYRLGSAPFVGAAAAGAPVAAPVASTPAPCEAGASQVWLAGPHGPLACFSLRDGLRLDAAATIAALRRRGLRIVIMSGDSEAAVRAVAASVDVPNWQAGLLPAQKLAALRDLQAGGAIVAMVGDGCNDAAVLAAADVSFAMGKGSDLACLHADCVLLGDRLDDVRLAADGAAATMRVIRQNLAWAMLYNAGAIPAAAAGWVSPWLAAAGMSCSSALVVLNALRLRRLGRA